MEMATPQGDHCVGTANRPEHSRLLLGRNRLTPRRRAPTAISWRSRSLCSGLQLAQRVVHYRPPFLAYDYAKTCATKKKPTAVAL